MTTLQTRFTDAFRLTTPIAQAGMAFVGSAPDLAVAVSNAGALGSIGVGLMPPPALARTIAATRAGTPHPFHVNLITPFTSPEHVDVVCAAVVSAASFHWGHPPVAWIERLHAAGVRVFEQVGTVEAARRAVDDGVDVVVAQGLEAGGHNFATLPTFALLPLVVDAVAPALVLASGGIADGRGLAAALMLGADGVWVGTRLVATQESDAHDGYKARLVAAGGDDTVRTSLFGPDMPDFNPMRVLRNRVVDEWADRLDQLPAEWSTGGTAAAAAQWELPVIGHTVLPTGGTTNAAAQTELPTGGTTNAAAQGESGGQEIELRKFTNFVPMRGVTSGDLDEMPLLAGQGVGLIDSVEPAADVIAAMTKQARAALER